MFSCLVLVAINIFLRNMSTATAVSLRNSKYCCKPPCSIMQNSSAKLRKYLDRSQPAKVRFVQAALLVRGVVLEDHLPQPPSSRAGVLPVQFIDRIFVQVDGHHRTGTRRYCCCCCCCCCCGGWCCCCCCCCCSYYCCVFFTLKHRPAWRVQRPWSQPDLTPLNMCTTLIQTGPNSNDPGNKNTRSDSQCFPDRIQAPL